MGWDWEHRFAPEKPVRAGLARRHWAVLWSIAATARRAKVILRMQGLALHDELDGEGSSPRGAPATTELVLARPGGLDLFGNAWLHRMRERLMLWPRLARHLVSRPLTDAAGDRAGRDRGGARRSGWRRRRARGSAAAWRSARWMPASCNGCELEVNALQSVLYDMERFGLRFVASPRHADVLLVTGPVTPQHARGAGTRARLHAGALLGGGRRRLRGGWRRVQGQLCGGGRRRGRAAGGPGDPRLPAHARAAAGGLAGPDRGRGDPRAKIRAGWSEQQYATEPGYNGVLLAVILNKPAFPLQGHLPRAAHRAVGGAELHHRADLEGHVPPAVRRHQRAPRAARAASRSLVRVVLDRVRRERGHQHLAGLPVHDGGLARRAAEHPRGSLRGRRGRRRVAAGSSSATSPCPCSRPALLSRRSSWARCGPSTCSTSSTWSPAASRAARPTSWSPRRTAGRSSATSATASPRPTRSSSSSSCLACTLVTNRMARATEDVLTSMTRAPRTPSRPTLLL